MNKKPISGGAFTLIEFVRSSDNAGSSPRKGEQDVNSGKKIVIFTVSSADKVRRECSDLRAVFGRYGSVSSSYLILYYTHITLSRKNLHTPNKCYNQSEGRGPLAQWVGEPNPYDEF